ncbi:hypothetical protein [Sediminispirochaeta smaragdinae]|uniref:hypothetical protein n=1 Tax=Sediminispirochaeta smaragdinae TaxID=55206 RepID=UPI0011D0AFBF|nr:hypothetical protein [Sediminispirochaeta smaragdinae]
MSVLHRPAIFFLCRDRLYADILFDVCPFRSVPVSLAERALIISSLRFCGEDYLLARKISTLMSVFFASPLPDFLFASSDTKGDEKRFCYHPFPISADEIIAFLSITAS